MSLSPLFVSLFAAMGGAGPDGGIADATADVVRLEARETAGIRRRSDVVSGEVRFPEPVPDATRFRLVDGGRPVAAQLVPSRDEQGRITGVAIDCIGGFAPLEHREYELEYGPDVTPSPQPPAGLVLTRDDTGITISNRGRSSWRVMPSLQGLVRYDRGSTQFVGGGSTGIQVRADGVLHSLGQRAPDRLQVVRSGPICCVLAAEYTDWPVPGRCLVRMEFVRTKSWVRVLWRAADSARRITGVDCRLNLSVDDTEKLLDFGAGDYVYATLRDGQAAELSARPRDGGGSAWYVRHGRADSLEPFVTGTAAHRRVGGWMHISDTTRCTALVVPRFGVVSSDRLAITGTGRLTIAREFMPQQPGPRELEFAIHFVSTPVQIGARTSPQSMAAPIRLTASR